MLEQQAAKKHRGPETAKKPVASARGKASWEWAWSFSIALLLERVHFRMIPTPIHVGEPVIFSSATGRAM